ncbi:MAG: hypothetical protein ACXAC2_25675 [Candidatus Kariarchaeaceae archaeon]|jgi:hypothetical protein
MSKSASDLKLTAIYTLKISIFFHLVVVLLIIVRQIQFSSSLKFFLKQLTPKDSSFLSISLGLIMIIDLVLISYTILLFINFDRGLNFSILFFLSLFGLTSLIARALILPELINIYSILLPENLLGYILILFILIILLLIPIISFIDSITINVISQNEKKRSHMHRQKVIAITSLTISILNVLMLVFPLFAALVFYSWNRISLEPGIN